MWFVFAGKDPKGGWNDLAGGFKTYEEAKAFGEKLLADGKADWVHAADTETLACNGAQVAGMPAAA